MILFNLLFKIFYFIISIHELLLLFYRTLSFKLRKLRISLNLHLKFKKIFLNSLLLLLSIIHYLSHYEDKQLYSIINIFIIILLLLCDLTIFFLNFMGISYFGKNNHSRILKNLNFRQLLVF